MCGSGVQSAISPRANQQQSSLGHLRASGPCTARLDRPQRGDSFAYQGRSCCSFLPRYVAWVAPKSVAKRRPWACPTTGVPTAGRLLRSPLIGAPPTHVIENLVPIVQFERAATEAIMARSTRLLRDALSVHPWIRDHAQLESIVDEIVFTNDAILSTAPRG